MTTAVKLALIDNSIDAEAYAPCVHWAEVLPVPFEAFRAKLGRLPRRADEFSHLILSGSEASILERDPWAEDEAEFVLEARARGARVLGSCWGHQLLAYALAGPGSVRRCREPEIGWIEVRVPERCGLLGAAGAAWTFSFHSDEVMGLGPGFRTLAESPVCAVQAFEVPGQPVWGLQIHPEITPERGLEMLRRRAGAPGPLQAAARVALESGPRDSGLIRSIVAAFLGGEGEGQIK